MLRKLEKPFDHTPISEGMRYGPFPPPELDHEPTSAGWIMDEAGGDPGLYQLLMLRDSLRHDKVEDVIPEAVFDANDGRLTHEITRLIGKRAIPRLRQQLKGRD